MSNVNFDFKNKNVVITGGFTGIGYQMAQDFINSGANVSLWGRKEEAITRVKAELSKFGARVHIVEADVTDRDSLLKAKDSLPWEVDILVNNAGVTRDKSFAKMKPEDWDTVVNTNLTGIFNVTSTLLDKFSATSTHKRIINISSVVGLYGNFGQTNYAATKAGVIGMTKSLAKELGRKGFTVNAIAPGFILTPMTAAMPKEILDQMGSKTPVARLGTPQDISNACQFLASEQASYITGSVLSVDGGIVL